MKKIGFFKSDNKYNLNDSVITFRNPRDTFYTYLYCDKSQANPFPPCGYLNWHWIDSIIAEFD